MTKVRAEILRIRVDEGVRHPALLLFLRPMAPMGAGVGRKYELPWAPTHQSGMALTPRALDIRTVVPGNLNPTLSKPQSPC